jgi:hypothetical protein
MYQGTVYISTKFQPDWTSNMAARWPSWKTNKELLTRNLVQFHSSLILDLATRGPKLKTQKVLLLLN